MSKHQWRHYGIFLISLWLLWLCAESPVKYRANLARWDWMLISGVITFIIGILLAKSIPKKLTLTLVRLVNREALLVDTEQLEKLKTRLEIRARIWEDRVGLFSMVAIMIAFLVSTGFSSMQLMIVEVIAAYFAGVYLGRIASYGMLKQMLDREALPLKVQPGHLDRVSGFKPLGDFYLSLSMVTAIPAVYLATWWLIIPLVPQYSWWRESYLGLLAVAIAFPILAFAVPLWLFHLEMKRQKVQLLQEADSLSQSILNIEDQLVLTQSAREREQLEEQLSHVSRRYWNIKNMSTWPLNFKVRSQVL